MIRCGSQLNLGDDREEEGKFDPHFLIYGTECRVRILPPQIKRRGTSYL